MFVAFINDKSDLGRLGVQQAPSRSRSPEELRIGSVEDREASRITSRTDSNEHASRRNNTIVFLRRYFPLANFKLDEP